MSTATVLKKKYRITSGLDGAATLELNLTIDGDGTVYGNGTITQPVSPPVFMKTRIHGTYLNVDSRHVVRAVGQVPPPADDPLLGPENCKLAMSMDDDWDEGTAEFSFVTASGKWVSSGEVPVKSA